MRTLVIDCATPALSLALFDDKSCLASRHAVLGRGHAEALIPQIAEMLGGGRADAIAVDVGPGSFTGIRVGLAAARALGFAWGVPVSGFGCLSLCAAMIRQSRPPADDPIAIVMIGGHGELFWQRFDAAGLAPLGPLASTAPEALATLLDDPVVHGSGAETLIAARGWGEAAPCLPDARAFPLLSEAEATLPPVALYGREADAKPMAAREAGA
ncbi:MAG TPA: tRNA (adenosine(37)-N6)-threonylcarbamoyltransferase complex dimerization subunit type 1 TsaB [Sphingobium sp.]|nr:tRNA (adenosine(37)-N6)-threonylcarbamoyltransferase complex dimerization subunit type 1 TsaB [Sphingobium sp.]